MAVYISPSLTPTVISASTYSPLPYQTVIPIVNTVGSVFNYPINYPVINPIYPSIVTYPDVNGNKHLRKQITEYFTEKIRNNWLKYHYLEIYGFVKVEGQSAKLISNLSEFDSNAKNSQSDSTIKHHFIIHNYLKQNDIYVLLEKFRKLNDLNWWDIKKHSDKFRKFVQYKLTKYIKAQIGKNE